jgi:molecular chaperone GrpE
MDPVRGGPPGKADGADTSFKVVDRRPRYDEAAETPSAPDGPAAPEGLTATEGGQPSVKDESLRRAEDAERRLKEISAAYVRLEQDREAFRERLSRDLDRRVDIARADLLRKVIEVLDDLDRALAAARTGAPGEALLRGVALTRERLLQTLASEGVETAETVGRLFDPSVAEAVSTEEVDDPERDNLVIEELARGYTLGGRALRAARVRVARHRGSGPRGGEGRETAPSSARPEGDEAPVRTPDR